MTKTIQLSSSYYFPGFLCVHVRYAQLPKVPETIHMAYPSYDNE